MKTKFRIADTACGNNELIWSMKIEDEVDCRSIELKGIENTETSYMRDRLTRNLVSLLVENRCFTSEKGQKLKQLEQKQKQHELFKFLENGSVVEMYEIVIDYLERTGQHEVVQMLQLNMEVQKYGKHIVNCLAKATDILNNKNEKQIILSTLLDHFSAKNHPVHSRNSNRFRDNENILNILECSEHDVYIFFLNFLLTTAQQELLLPMFKSIPHSKLIENFELYLLDSINADSDLLIQLYKFYVINSTQKRTIESKRTLKGRNKELLNIISKTTPKSFNLFLTALVRTGRSNFVGKMRLTSLTAGTTN